MKIALITPQSKKDYLSDTIIDGLISYAEKNPNVEISFSSKYHFDSVFSKWYQPRDLFVNFARNAEIIIFINGKDNTDYSLANEINCFDKTVFVDGGEMGRNRRLDERETSLLFDRDYRGRGFVDFEMLSKCKYYFRREKPYIDSIIPFAFGIERKYTKYSSNLSRDIDVVGIFGQTEFPPLRAQIIESLENITSKYNIRTSKTKNSFFGLRKDAQDKFYRLLSQSKIGISVSGGGYDTARFWEILGSNCILFTEKIDIYRDQDEMFNFSRIHQFQNLDDFQDKIGDLIDQARKIDWKAMQEEYMKILNKHSSLARVESILNTFFKNE